MASSASRNVDLSTLRCKDCGKQATKTDVYPRAGPTPPRCGRCKTRRRKNGPCPRCDRGMFRRNGLIACAECTSDPISIVDQFKGNGGSHSP